MLIKEKAETEVVTGFVCDRCGKTVLETDDSLSSFDHQNGNGFFCHVTYPSQKHRYFVWIA